jgi:GT2 family glycosyltransferase
MNITVAVLVLNQQELTQRWLDTIRENEGSAKLPLLVIDNGSTPPVRDWLIGLRDGDLVVRNDENIGVMPGLNQAWQVLKDVTDYIFFPHNDLMIYEKNWDDKLVRVLSDLPDCGVAGFYGAKGIGTNDIYRSPYVMQQLIRLENVSACTRMNAAVHGFRPPRGETEEVAVMDGFSLIVRTELLNKLGGFDRSYPPHHNYDNDICLESIDKGYRNFVISMDADHLGGRTDVGEDWNKNFGKTKAEIHRDAHPVLYNKWSPDNVANGKHKIALPIRRGI